MNHLLADRLIRNTSDTHKYLQLEVKRRMGSEFELVAESQLSVRRTRDLALVPQPDKCLRLETGEQIRALEGHDGRIRTIQLSPDGNRLISPWTVESHCRSIQRLVARARVVHNAGRGPKRGF